MHLQIVLVRTIYSSNIGAVARVMGNMGASRLILIDPRCEVNSKARQSAAGAQKYLAQRLTYDSWDHFYQNEGQGVRIGLTRRDGKLRSVVPLPDLLDQLPALLKGQPPQPIYLILGPEDDGLAAEDLSFLNHCASLPHFGQFPSMNLSHAALLGSYLIQEWIQKRNNNPTMNLNGSCTSSPSSPLFFPDQAIRDWLDAMGFSLSRRRASAYTTLRRILLHNQPTESELQVLEAILRQNIRKLRERDS